VKTAKYLLTIELPLSHIAFIHQYPKKLLDFRHIPGVKPLNSIFHTLIHVLSEMCGNL